MRGVNGRKASSRPSLSRRDGGRLVTAWKWLTNTVEGGSGGGEGARDYVNTDNNANRFEIASIIPQSFDWSTRRVAREENVEGGERGRGGEGIRKREASPSWEILFSGNNCVEIASENRVRNGGKGWRDRAHTEIASGRSLPCIAANRRRASLIILTSPTWITTGAAEKSQRRLASFS